MRIGENYKNSKTKQNKKKKNELEYRNSLTEWHYKTHLLKNLSIISA